MSQYNAQPDSTAESAGWEAFDPELAPFHPTMDQSGGWALPHHAGTGPAKARVPRCEPPEPESSKREKFTPPAITVHTHARIESHPAHTCISCSTSFPNNYQLEQHATKNKHKAYVCICGKSFAKLSALRRHIEESTQARKHKCPLCDNEFKRPGHVEQHLRLIHEKPKDVTKDLLRGQKSQLRQEPEQASTASAMILAEPMAARVDQPVDVPAETWTGPIGVSTMAPADHPGSRPGDFAALFSGLPTSGSGLVPEIPAYTPQSFMPQATDQAYHAHQTTVAANHTGLPTKTAPDFVGYPAAYPAGDLELFNVGPATMTGNPVGAFRVPLENDFTGEFLDIDFEIDLSNFDF